MTAFEEMGIMPEIGKALEEIEWLLPTNIQADAISADSGRWRWFLKAAETGSGKRRVPSQSASPANSLGDDARARWDPSSAGDPFADKWVLSAIDRSEDGYP